jgi:glycosyltransferase involved in cell wall biosynthesis
MRIVHVIDSLGPGGAEHSLVHVLTRWRAHQHEVVALGPDYSLAPQLEQVGIPVHRYDITGIRDLGGAVARLCVYLRRATPEIVRGYLFLGGLAVALSRLGAPAPLRVLSFHGVDYDAFPVRGHLQRGFQRARGFVLSRGADGWVGISQAVADHYRRELGLDLDVIHNSFPIDALDPARPIDRTRILARFGVTEPEYVLVMPARYSIEKGHAVLLAALGQLRARGRAPHVLFFGHGPLRTELATQARDLGLADRLRFFDPIPQTELYDVLRASNALVLPTPHGEGFGRAPAEAMALEKPVIVSRVGGVLDFVEHGESGLLVEPFSSVALADAIETLMTDPELSRRLGRAGRNTILQRFTIEAAIARWETYLAKVQRRRRAETRSTF